MNRSQFIFAPLLTGAVSQMARFLLSATGHLNAKACEQYLCWWMD
jgi:hypothetical protein